MEVWYVLSYLLIILNKPKIFKLKCLRKTKFICFYFSFQIKFIVGFHVRFIMNLLIMSQQQLNLVKD